MNFRAPSYNIVEVSMDFHNVDDPNFNERHYKYGVPKLRTLAYSLDKTRATDIRLFNLAPIEFEIRSDIFEL
jgi:hypothetical protein